MAESDISPFDPGRSPAQNDAALAHATRLILQVCHLAGTAAFIDEAGLGPGGKDLREAIRGRNTADLFDWLVAALSYQGISDQVASDFIDRHGLAWRPGPDRLTRMRAALLDPLREVYGVSDKVLMMALSGLLLASTKPIWAEVGASMIAIDTLVHNFLHRTGILHRFDASHAYGVACYRPHSCADVIRSVAAQIDARQFNRTFPQIFPRFVQHAIWRYCAQNYFGICNGNRINDREPCQNGHCRLYWLCDSKSLINQRF